MNNTNEDIQSPTPYNNAGSGSVDGIGVGPRGEPGANPKKKLRTLFPMMKRKTLRDITKEN